jgi:heme A synthase
MHQPLRSWPAGASGFAFVVVWASLGATTAIVAVVVGVAAMHHRSVGPLLARCLALGRRTRSRKRPARRRAAAAPDDYQLVPDDPSLVVSVYS